MIHLLLVEDDLNFGLILFDRLKDIGFKPHWAKNGKEGLKFFNEFEVSLCLIDVMMPEKDGFSLVEDIRKLNTEVPIIMLTAKSLLEDKVKGFKSGADDYVTKPFEFEELEMRIRALLKRTGQENESANQLLPIGNYSFDTNLLTLHIDDKKAKLTNREAEILKVLLKHKNTVLERQVILNMVWGDDNYFNGRSLDVFISRLRKYLLEDDRIQIVNVHRKGFMLEIS